MKWMHRFEAPIAEGPWSRRREVWISAAGVAFTALASAMVARDQWPIWQAELAAGEWLKAAGHAAFLMVAALLVYGGGVYQITRLLYARRRLKPTLEPPQPSRTPELTVLVPSYKEEPEVIHQTLMSAALQEIDGLEVVLLIDNPPNPSAPEDIALLKAARTATGDLQTLLDAERHAIEKLLATDGPQVAAAHAADWFEAQAARWMDRPHAASPHTDHFYACEILLDRAIQLRQEVAREAVNVSRLLATFSVRLSSFERKLHPELSQLANKAMNLNSYIGLMTGTGSGTGTGSVRASEFLITLDADSLILPGYAETLLGVMQAPGGERIAVCQTPYSAIPGAPGVLERVAGATTDVQYIIHQGFTAWDGTYWVGANAMMRLKALQDIAETTIENGHPVTRFIQDRTVIEDTESTIDLVAKGWRLHNVPERLAFSATPPDFGSLLIQRRRWANGGLLILRKTLKHLRQVARHNPLAASREAFVRIHYLVSITTVNFGLLLLLAFPFTSSVGTFWLPLTAVPYFALYGRDLRLMGYAPGDLFRVYALNLLLIPVHIGGVLQSLRQAFRGDQIPFSRTPKVADRTSVSPPYIAVTYFLIGQWTTGAFWDFYNGYPSHGVFAILNAAIMAYAVGTFIGWRSSWHDL